MRGEARADQTRARAEPSRRQRHRAQVRRQMALENGQDQRRKHVDPFRDASGHDHRLAAQQRDSAGDRGAKRRARLPQRLRARRRRLRAPLRSALARPPSRRALRWRRALSPRRCVRASRGLRSPGSAGSAQAQPKEAAAPPRPCTIRPSARTAEPMPVPIARRMTSEALRAAPSAASARRASLASLPSATVTPENMAPGPARRGRADSAPSRRRSPTPAREPRRRCCDTLCASMRLPTRRRNASISAGAGQSPEALGLACRAEKRGAQPRASEVDAKRGHPLIPVLTMLSTKNRCRKANRISGGSTANVAPAITRFVFMAPRL